MQYVFVLWVDSQNVPLAIHPLMSCNAKSFAIHLLMSAHALWLWFAGSVPPNHGE